MGPERTLSIVAGLAAALFASAAAAADVLFVADASSDRNIVGVLTDDGHTVTEVTGDFATGNATLAGLSPGDYDAVVWVANGSGPGSAHSDTAVFDALTAYVESGGRVFVTGYDSIASPTDPNLVAFIGGTSSRDGAAVPGPVLDEESSLTMGVVDIRGVVPSGYYSDRDSVVGLTPGTVGIVSSDSDWQWTLRELGAGEIAYVSNGGLSGDHASWTTTTAGGAGAYNAAVRNFVSGAAAGAPRLRWVEGQAFEVDEGGELELAVTVEDREGDATTTGWDLDGDGEYDDATGDSVTVSAAGLDGPTTIEVAVQACDTFENCSHRRATIEVLNAPPQFTNVPEDTNILIGQEWTYQPEVVDPGGDAVTVSVADRPAGMVLLPGGGVRWTPTADHVGEWTLTFVATDDDHSRVGNGETTLVIVLTVRENQAPAAPRIVSPDRGEDVTVARPALVVQNPVDPEGDPLQILYEIDTSDTFRSPVSSGPVPAGSDGTTSWTVPQDLADGARYYWRVWATDGLAEGSRVSSYFFVTLEGGDGGPDGGLDGGGDTGPIGPVVDPGCSCRAGASAGGGAGLVLLLLLAVVGRGLIRR